MNDRHITNDRGFTLLEVLVALTILAVAMMGLLSVVGSTSKAVDTAKRQTQAINISSEKMEMLKSVPFNNIQSTDALDSVPRTCSGTAPDFECTPTSATVTLGNMTYTWRYNVTYIDLDGDGNYLNSDGLFDQSDIKRMDIIVSWTIGTKNYSNTLSSLREF